MFLTLVLIAAELVEMHNVLYYKTPEDLDLLDKLDNKRPKVLLLENANEESLKPLLEKLEAKKRTDSHWRCNVEFSMQREFPPSLQRTLELCRPEHISIEIKEPMALDLKNYLRTVLDDLKSINILVHLPDHNKDLSIIEHFNDTMIEDIVTILTKAPHLKNLRIHSPNLTDHNIKTFFKALETVTSEGMRLPELNILTFNFEGEESVDHLIAEFERFFDPYIKVNIQRI